MKINYEFDSMEDLYNFVREMYKNINPFQDISERLEENIIADNKRLSSDLYITKLQLDRAFKRLLICDPKGLTANFDSDDEKSDTKETPIERLELSTRAYNALYLENIHTVEKLVLTLKNDIRFLGRLPNVGKLTIKEIETCLANYLGGQK